MQAVVASALLRDSTVPTRLLQVRCSRPVCRKDPQGCGPRLQRPGSGKAPGMPCVGAVGPLRGGWVLAETPVSGGLGPTWVVSVGVLHTGLPTCSAGSLLDWSLSSWRRCQMRRCFCL